MSLLFSHTHNALWGGYFWPFRVQPFWSQDPWPKRADDEQQHQLRLRVPEDQSEEIAIRQVLDKYLQYSTKNWTTAYKVTINTMNWLFLHMFFLVILLTSPPPRNDVPFLMICVWVQELGNKTSSPATCHSHEITAISWQQQSNCPVDYWWMKSSPTFLLDFTYSRNSFTWI